MATSAADTTVENTTVTRLAAPAAFVAAAGFVVEGVISLVHHTGDDHWDALSQVLGGAYAVATVALFVALPAVALCLRVNRVGRVATVVAQIGFVAMVAESIASGINDGNTLGGLFFAGLVLSLLGQLVLGIAGLTAGHRRWAAMLPFLALFVGIAGGEHGGSIVSGVVWAVLAMALLRPDE
jgi:hypothetical protein